MRNALSRGGLKHLDPAARDEVRIMLKIGERELLLNDLLSQH